MEELENAQKIRAEELAIAKRKLASRISRWTKDTGQNSEIPGLILYSATAPTDLILYTHHPSLCLVAQGKKRIVLGSENLFYDPDHCLVSSIDLPVAGQIIEASPERPYLGLAFKLEQRAITQLLIEGALSPPNSSSSSKGMSVEELTLNVISAILRLIDLLEWPESIPYLAPTIQREIYYWLLNGIDSPQLRQWAVASSHNSQISRAVDWIKSNFASPLKIEYLAEICRMSPSSFHLHFRNATAMSPLQYQKHLRLQEARRLMLVDNEDVTTAAFRVGYEGSSQFSREYRRLFGVPPSQDIRTLKLSPLTQQAAGV